MNAPASVDPTGFYAQPDMPLPDDVQLEKEAWDMAQEALERLRLAQGAMGEPVTEELWAAVEARLKAERIAAGDCFACGFDDFLLYCPMGGGTVDSDTDICTCCHDHVVGVKVCVSCGTWQNEAER